MRDIFRFARTPRFARHSPMCTTPPLIKACIENLEQLISRNSITDILMDFLMNMHFIWMHFINFQNFVMHNSKRNTQFRKPR
jgi:hypothetical protein